MKAGCSYELVDIKLSTLTIDFDLLFERLSHFRHREVALLLVRPYGFLEDLEEIMMNLKSTHRNCIIIDDQCLCVPNVDIEVKGSADMVLFSTGYSKYIDMSGGGFAIMKSSLPYQFSYSYEYSESALEEINDSIRYCLEEGLIFTYRDTHWLDLRERQFNEDKYLAEIRRKIKQVGLSKKMINDRYVEVIGEERVFGSAYNDWRFNLLVNNKDVLIKSIFDQGLFASSHYPLTICFPRSA